MNPHLTDIETLSAADGSLEAARLAHTAGCASCQARVADAKTFIARVADTAVPEPSPLFWDHFSQRVRQATLAEAPAARRSWRGWIPLAATAATVVFAAWLVEQPRPTNNRLSMPSISEAAGDNGTEIAWDSVLATTPEWADDDLFALADQDAMSIDDLTAEERRTFVRLLEEMEVRQ